MKGLFITFEGGEGSGKTTVIEKLNAFFTSKGYEVVMTREPGGIPIAEQIRSIILDVNNTEMTKETETLLYAAARMQHLSQKVLPALDEGKIVLCDRYVDSSLVYQGIARNVGIKEVETANAFAMKHLPDCTFFLDVTPDVGLGRIKARTEKLDRLDLEKLEFHKLVYNGYKTIAKRYSKRIKTIDGNQSPEIVFNTITKQIEKLLG